MSDNNIQHAESICDMLRYNTTLTTLVLAENGFNDKDAALLAQVIEVSYTLKLCSYIEGLWCYTIKVFRYLEGG